MLFRWLAIFLCFVSLTSCRSNGQGEVSNKNVTFISTKISINDGNVLENVSSGIVSLTVSLNTASTIPVSVEYFTQNGMASSGQDYTSATGTITFAPGETRKTISIAVINDTLQEPSTETFTVHLTAPLHAILDKSVGTVTIQDDDDTVRTLTVAPAVTNEGASGINSTLDFVATLSSAAPSDVSVNFTTEDVTANVGSDYRMASGILVIPAGSTTAHIVVDVVGDNTFEPDETIALRLSNVVGVVLNTMTAIGTIRNDDAGVIVNPVQTLESNKGQSAQLVFTVTVVGSHGAVSMNYATVAGTASAGAATETTADYLATSGTLNFAANENSKTITVTVHGDDCLEPNEMFTFAITVMAQSNF